MQFPGVMQTSFPYSPPPQGMGSPFNFNQQAQAQAQMNFRPNWATEMIETVKAMSKELGKLNTIENNSFWYQNICAEARIQGRGNGQLKTEKSCDFLGKEYEDQKKELQAAKSNISGLQKRFNDLEDKYKDYETKTSKRKKKKKQTFFYLESRSMRENSVFRDVPENVNGNCETVVNQFCFEKLNYLKPRSVPSFLTGFTESVESRNLNRVIFTQQWRKSTDTENEKKIGNLGTRKKLNLAVRPQL